MLRIALGEQPRIRPGLTMPFPGLSNSSQSRPSDLAGFLNFDPCQLGRMNKGLSFLELMRNSQQSSREALSAVHSTDPYSVNVSHEDEVRPTLEGA